jgi:hypothetical protein
LSDPWLYQIRINLTGEYAEKARNKADDPALAPLYEILSRRGAALRNQFDAFAEYVSEAEKNGVEHFPLYKWTKATIEDPAKKEKYSKSFTLFVNGAEIYGKEIADALEAELQPHVAHGPIEKLSKHDTNPANNPQPPAHLR